MVLVIKAKNINMIYLKEKFRLQKVDDDIFFSECFEDVPDITHEEKLFLDKVKTHYLSMIERSPISEELVKMVVLSPLLDFAGFYRHPFYLQTEESVEITLEDKEEIVRGRIDVLVLKQKFWILVIESKNAGFSLLNAIPQALAYMLGTPYPELPTYGLVLNGSEFIFIKLTNQNKPLYALSDQFTLWKRENELYQVLGILKKLSQILS